MIINASPLIIFGKTNRLDILKKLYKDINIAKSVYDEVVARGMEKNLKDALIIKEHIENKVINIRDLDTKHNELSIKIQEIYNIGAGEADTIALALQLNKKQLVIDEKRAREAAKALGIIPMGSLRVLQMAHQTGLITKAEIWALIKEMEELEYRFGPQVLMEFLDILEKTKKKSKIK